MPEIKHVFQSGKMNKDIDERLVQNGEYRDALNIQVRTTDANSSGVGDAGTAQNIKGNKFIASGVTYTKSYKDDDNSGSKDYTRIIGSVADEANDRAFFFVADPLPFDGIHHGVPYSDIVAESLNDDGSTRLGYSLRQWKDSIFEINYNPPVGNTQNHDAIFTDVYMITATYSDMVGPENTSDSTDYAYLTVRNQLYGARNIRIGMSLHAWDTNGNHLLWHSRTLPDGSVIKEEGVKVINIVEDPNNATNNLIVLAEKQTEDLEEKCVAMKFFSEERVLEFDYYKRSENTLQRIKNTLTGINILDDMLFWTDGVHEPKKINIERSREGTVNDTIHTQLYVTHPVTGDIVIVTDDDIEPNLLSADIKQENITVIKQAPTSAPKLKLATSDRASDTTFEIDHNFVSDTLLVPTEGSIINDITFPSTIDCRVDDVFKFTADNLFANEPMVVRGKVISVEEWPDVVIRLSFVSDDVVEINPLDWEVELEQRKPLFETKFGRFGYRYKYDDGEYSSFSPWSELAFLPGDFEYTPSKGYNKAMTSNVRSLIITDFVPNDVSGIINGGENINPIVSIKPNDIKEIDILWKTTDNQNVYVVKSITRAKDIEWTADENGSMSVTSEMIHKVLPANQTLRGWDNVPRNAIAQEMTANRLIYGNYIQGYDILIPFGLKQSIKSNNIQFPSPKKSIKSSRNYKFGAVFGDKYGRETPVIASGYRNPLDEFSENELQENITGDLNVPKNLSSSSNKFQLEQSWSGSEPPDWMNYIKYFVKETSNEYYNLIMDRWYDAEDGNVWVAFPSVDRNKISEETFLILKNGHGNQNPVTEEARYKVIAIENEAPDYIKTVNNDFDLIKISRDKVYNDLVGNISDAIPDQLIAKKTIKLESAEWDETAPEVKDFKGIAKVRIVGTYNSASEGAVSEYSPWRNITKIINKDDDRGVVLREAFEEVDVNMYQKLILKLSTPSELIDNKADADDTASIHYIQYSLEFRDAIVENKPQFDGRFFVKLEKDSTLETSVLGSQVSYEVKNTYKVAYIAARQVNPADSDEDEVESVGTYSGVNWSTYTDGGANIFTTNEIDTIGGTGDNDVLNYNSLDNLTGDLPAVPSAGVTVNSINEDANDTHSIYGDDKNQVVSLFGPGDHSSNNFQTQQFWNWWWDQGSNLLGEGNNTARDTNIFIDEAPAYSGFSLIKEITGPDDNQYKRQVLQALGSGGQPISHLIDNNIYGPYPGTGNGDSTEATYPNPAYNLEWSESSGENQNWLPSGLSQGKATTDGHLGQFTFSVIKDDWDSISTDSLFKSDMTTPGTIFTFANDPNPGNRYKIINYQLTTNWLDGFEDFGEFSGMNLDIESTNFSATDDPLKKRYSIITRFCRLDDNNNELINEGIDTTQWDPRGDVRHDGIGSLEIQVLAQVGNFDLSDKSLATNAACWETEPKEDVGLDIYYEASEGIPLRLDDKKDLTIFTKPGKKSNASHIEIHRSYKKIESSTVPFLNRIIGNDGVHLQYQQYEYIGGVLTPGYNVDFKSAAIGDMIHFIHRSNPYSSGVVVKSKIIDFYDTLSLPGNTEIPIPSPRGSFTATPQPGVQDGFTQLYNAPTIFEGESLLGAQILSPNLAGVSIVTDIGNGYITITGKYAFPEGFNPLTEPTPPANFEFYINKGWYKIDTNVWKYPVELGWFNCYSFGNGVESDRIQDDFNAPTIDNGVKVSSTFLNYGEEHIGSGLIYSGLYNSMSSVNDLNEFNMAEKITKNLNPIYGSIQALKTAERNLTVLAEDKIIKVLANKDAIYNADGNPQLTATNRVLGDANPYSGDYGISKNPESLAWDQYRLYFTDKQRGAVLRLSNDGLTPISEIGMSAYFRDRMKKSDSMLGTFDTISGEYNLTLDSGWQWNSTIDPPVTISFNERSKGWTSFKSFIPSTGLSVNGRYLTTPGSDGYDGMKLAPWEHYDDNIERNNFYNTQYGSEIEVVFNDQPSIIKSFKTINYEGTQSKVNKYTGSTESYGADASNLSVSVNDGEYYNLIDKKGWWVESFTTDLQTGTVPEFINKENKWFNKINGKTTTLENLDTSEFSVQGLGFAAVVTSTPPVEADVVITDTFDGLTSTYGDDDLTND
jgi:hypothetical protein